MKRFPETVRKAMAASGAAVTCVPVKLDSNDWETAVYFQVSGSECKQDRRVLSNTEQPLSLGMETDLVEHQHAAVVLLRFEVHTFTDDPLVGEILLTPGESSMHFDVLKLLTHQPRLTWFFGDQHFWIIHSQQHPLSDEQHRGFGEMLGDAIKHDALVRCTSRYNARAALSEIVSKYELRAGVMRSGDGTINARELSKSRN